MKHKLMVIDDEALILKTIQFAFEDLYEVCVYKSGTAALKALKDEQPDLVLLDLRIKNENGIEVLQNIKQLMPAVEVIMMTAFGTIETTIAAMKAGAYHYIQKPLQIEEMRNLVGKAMELIVARKALQGIEGSKGYAFGLIGRSKAIETIINFIERSARTSSNVLITGESGTGKEVVAKAVHVAGRQSAGPFVPVNSSAIPDHLMESELFGHVKGAFTGAVEDRPGLIRMAHQGTLFFDEIGEMDLKLQAKLLRAIQEREYRPVGGNKLETFDARFIFATNRDLAKEVREGRFREDLYYRINVLRIEIPPLRDRRDDIPGLVNYIIRGLAHRDGIPTKAVSAGAMRLIEAQSFPGNVRELQNLVERIMIYCDGPVIDDQVVKGCLEASEIFSEGEATGGIRIPITSTLEEAERAIILRVLQHFEGNKRQTAESLGIAERTLRYKLKESLEE